MAECSICHDGRRLTRHGLQIHMGKVHDVHYGMTVPNTQMSVPIISADMGLPNPSTEPESESDSIRGEVSDLVPCGHPFCKVKLPRESLRAHWDSDHPTWLMHDGRYVWEYGMPDRGESLMVDAGHPKSYVVPKSIEV